MTITALCSEVIAMHRIGATRQHQRGTEFTAAKWQEQEPSIWKQTFSFGLQRAIFLDSTFEITNTKPAPHITTAAKIMRSVSLIVAER